MRPRSYLSWWLLVWLAGQVYFNPYLVGAAELSPESLNYSVDVLMLGDAVRANITLRRLGPDCYEGEISGHTRGILGFFTAHRRDRYRTRMIYNQGRLQPTTYWEESWLRGRHRYKEYRFDHQQGRLELWQPNGDGTLKLKWHTELDEPIYDPITAFYNFRLGAFGELKGGETITVSGIPYPHPEDINIHIGPTEHGRRKVAVKIRNRAFEDERGMVHILFDPQLVPLEAWTRVLVFGKISGRLLSESDQTKAERETLINVSQD
ncbi:MAG: DUF3108 domain-containing protein [Deltaproteobacteria bacterium]|nr:DUF3108 domain-containing protein [Deltaproteobacteria bacterium]MBW1953256.1 DUF3108 domain-containing protein [Deltaproteobacteria bacterium]MBW1987460.1 DUF3108 domain-containing protein [Deltaproteobacteria bacterium]MBW2135586.1 DUF3108 domain-containing protein [Deltaproteobacteria bacterium]